jgi:hypothetical protein
MKNRIEVVKYSYRLIVDGAHACGYDKDPTHDPAVHKHTGRDERRAPAEEITLEEALKRAWTYLDRYVADEWEEGDGP